MYKKKKKTYINISIYIQCVGWLIYTGSQYVSREGQKPLRIKLNFTELTEGSTEQKIPLQVL